MKSCQASGIPSVWSAENPSPWVTFPDRMSLSFRTTKLAWCACICSIFRVWMSHYIVNVSIPLWAGGAQQRWSCILGNKSRLMGRITGFGFSATFGPASIKPHHHSTNLSSLCLSLQRGSVCPCVIFTGGTSWIPADPG